MAATRRKVLTAIAVAPAALLLRARPTRKPVAVPPLRVTITLDSELLAISLHYAERAAREIASQYGGVPLLPKGHCATFSV